MTRRTYVIPKTLIEKVTTISLMLGINKSTIIRMAIIHGIEKVDGGYLPKRNHKELQKKRYPIQLPTETWNLFDSMKENIKYKLDEHIPEGELIELFIRMEIQKFEKLYRDYNVYLDEEVGLFADEDTDKKSMLIQTYIPKIIYEQMQERQQDTGVLETQLSRYLATNGIVQEFYSDDYHVIESDAELLEEIQTLGLDKLKTFTLFRYLLENNKITWNYEN